MSKENTIVVGAGVAGLAAARMLAENGREVTVIEARDRVGGRIHTVHSGDHVFELGAEFVHGLPSDLWELIHEADLRTEEMDGKQICYQEGRLKDCSFGWEHDLELLDQLKTWDQPDYTFAQYLDRENVPAARREHLISYVEGFNAADHRIIGVAALGKQQIAEDKIDGDRLFRVCDGYFRVPEFLANKIFTAGSSISLDTQVQSIAWSPGQVELTCSSGGEFRCIAASNAVITLPLGVLQQGSVKFLPEPVNIFHSVQSLRMGHVRRAQLLFRERFWATWENPTHLSLDELSFLFDFQHIPSTWWTQFPSRNACMTAWAGGPCADTLAALTTVEFRRRMCEQLACMFDTDIDTIQSLLIGLYSHDWQRDPLS
ncbi:MAG: NAD(P)/FAD-dependent oxidoreductase, partial [Acidobacteriaceae bacterium]